jgi:hypothetical protein
VGAARVEVRVLLRKSDLIRTVDTVIRPGSCDDPAYC